MVRTKANNACAKATGAKAPRKLAEQPSSPSSSGGYKGASNSMKIWPKPEWQKGVGAFFTASNQSSSNSDSNTISQVTEQPTSNDNPSS